MTKALPLHRRRHHRRFAFLDDFDDKANLYNKHSLAANHKDLEKKGTNRKDR